MSRLVAVRPARPGRRWLLGVLGALALGAAPAACAPGPLPDVLARLPAGTAVGGPAPAAEGLPAGYPVRPEGLPQGRVVRVVDGDTVDVALGSGRALVRLLGIDTPESVDPRQPVQCFGREAAAKAQELVEGRTVGLEADPSQDDRDRHGRLLRYVWLPNGRLVNLELVAQGYAHEYTFRAPHKHAEAFREAERRAREQGRGLWAPETCAGDTRRPAAGA
jgi:micrococcal nuclease